MSVRGIIRRHDRMIRGTVEETLGCRYQIGDAWDGCRSVENPRPVEPDLVDWLHAAIWGYIYPLALPEASTQFPQSFSVRRGVSSSGRLNDTTSSPRHMT